MDVPAGLKSQYHAALNMLKQAIEQCPDAMWNDGSLRLSAHPPIDCEHDTVPFWRVVYHTLYGTHLYLQPNEAAFRPWEHHRVDYNDLPWPPGSGVKISDPYTKAEMLDYWGLVVAMVDTAVDAIDLDAPESGFPWHKTMNKFEHQIQNIRHIQHHTAILAGRLRLANGADVRWVRKNAEMYTG